MRASSDTLFVTGATGQLGQLVILELLQSIPASRVFAGVRTVDSDAARQLAELGVTLRIADYDKPDTLAAAFAGMDRLLLISSNAVGRRVAQHGAAITAAKTAGVEFIAYTSVLHADRSKLALAEEHRASEALLRASGVAHTLLRNGWYNENHAASIAPALAHGSFLGGAGEGRISAAARADYAAAAAAVLLMAQPDSVYELAGDRSYTLPAFTAELEQQAQAPIVYKDLPQAAFESALKGAGLPDEIAALIADSDAVARDDDLFDDSRQLSTLIGRPTVPIATTIAETLARR